MGLEPGPRAYLAALTIRDFAIVDSLRIEWSPGLSVLSGETGAGKSIIVDALGAALGDRAESTWIRAGAERAFAEALFVIAPQAEEVRSFLRDLDCPMDDDLLVLSRDIFVGRSVSRVNGRAMPASAAQELASRLVDVHSQASHLSLLRTREHLEVLDRYGGLSDLRGRMAETVHALRRAGSEIERLEQDRRQGEREAVLLGHEIQEIDATGVHEGEDEELAARRSRARNAARLRQLAADAHGALRGGEESSGALDLLEVAIARIEELALLDPSWQAADHRLPELADAADELDRGLRRYGEAMDEDDAALELLEERLLLLADLKRKFGPTLGDVVAYRARSAARLDAHEHHEERLAELRSTEAEYSAEARRVARSLSDARTDAARRLELAVNEQLRHVGMGSVRLVIGVASRSANEGGESLDDTGADRVEFLVASNPGEPPRPLARIASGGELARIMLAFRSALAAVDRTPVLVFDELDQGVGGRTGHAIGERLWRLARHHQVLCITHLPQVAVYADYHYAATKRLADGRTVASVSCLSDEQRAEEVAMMLVGPQAGETSRMSADQLLGHAGEWKRQAS